MLLVPHTLLNYIRLGVSQQVVYLIRKDRYHMMKLLSPFLSLGLVTIVWIGDFTNDTSYDFTCRSVKKTSPAFCVSNMEG